MRITTVGRIVPLVAIGFAVQTASAQLYEADSGSGKILEFTSAGVESTFASGLNEPRGLAIDATGNLFATASGSGKILKFTPAAVKSTFASGLNKPRGLAFDANGNLFVADSGSGQISKFTPDGVESAFAIGLTEPLGLAFDGFGNLFVSSSTGVAGGGEILKLTPAGTKSTFATGLFTPTSLAFAANGNFYVADSSTAHIYEFTPDGVRSTFASGSTFGLAFDASGNLFNSNGGSSILEFPSGGAETSFATGLSQSGLLAFAPFTALYSLDVTYGNTFRENFYPRLVQATDGYLYGTTSYGGGAEGEGTVFRISPTGSQTSLYSFCTQSLCADDGADPVGALVQATNGDLYGTTTNYGANGGGTVFKITTSGKLTTLYDFCAQSGCTDGENPNGGLVQATGGDLFGTTIGGGAHGGGTIFKITLSGTLTTLYSFCSQNGCADGYSPNSGLVQATNGNFYGTTYNGGSNGNVGTVFKITRSGTLTTLYSFCAQAGCVDGELPQGGLVQTASGDFYGTAAGGANYGGTIFKISPSGTLTTLYNFCSQSACTDGAGPGGLVQATDGNFYGTTYNGGSNGNVGTVFKITRSGTLTTLHSFCSQPYCADGAYPGSLVQETNGKLYGTASLGGAIGNGTIFSFSLGLDAFVKTQTASGNVGEAVEILGTNLTGATRVTFNGVAATFTVLSSSEISTTIPAGATTGPVQVTTPYGTLSSNVHFRVL